MLLTRHRGASLKAIKMGGLRPKYEGAVLCNELGMHVNLACKIAESGIATAAVLQWPPRRRRSIGAFR